MVTLTKLKCREHNHKLIRITEQYKFYRCKTCKMIHKKERW